MEKKEMVGTFTDNDSNNLKNNCEKDELLKNLFEKSKIEFYEVLKDSNIRKLFDLIDKINTSENKDKKIDSFSYSQILYSIFNFYSNFEYNINIRESFNYIIDMIGFLRDVELCIDDDGELYFARFTVQYKYDEIYLNKLQNKSILEALKKPYIVYSFSSRQFEYEEAVKRDFLKHYNGYNILDVERISVDYEKLFNILEEIIKDENWEYRHNEISGVSYYVFNEKKAFDKYFK